MRRLRIEPRWAVVILFFAAGAFLGAVGFFIWIFNGGAVLGVQRLGPTAGHFKYLNPSLANDTLTVEPSLEGTIIDSAVKKLVERHKNPGLITDAAIYFRDLNTNTTVGFNQDQSYPVSRDLKIPILMAYLKKAESDPQLLDRQLGVPASPPSVQTQADIPIQYQTDTIESLLETMIIEDNDAVANMLIANIDSQDIRDVYTELGLGQVPAPNVQIQISSRTYSVFFSVLYNATYLNTEMSDKALTILDETNNLNGVGLSLSNDLQIPHKYRLDTFQSAKATFLQARDCGIIYYPGNPYVLCAIARANNQAAIDDFFKDLNQTVYQLMDARHNLKGNN